jgi:hypothetical protein
MSRIIAGVLLGLATLLAVATARLLDQGRQHLEEGESLARRGDRGGAVVAFEEAARAYVPGSPYPRRACERMEIIAKGHEMRGDTRRSASTWEAIRRSVLASRHLVQPHADVLERAERELRRLRQRPSASAATDPAVDPAVRPDDPSVLHSLLLFVGLLGWIGGALTLITMAGPAGEGRARALPRVMAWGVCLGGLALWLTMSWLAG